MRLTITTHELVMCLSRPALRALREVGTSLGAPVSQVAPGMGEAPLATMSGAALAEQGAGAREVPPTGMPAGPVHTASLAPGEGDSVSLPVLERLEQTPLLPAAARHEVALPPAKRLVGVLPRSMRGEVPSSAPEVRWAEGTRSPPLAVEGASRPVSSPPRAARRVMALRPGRRPTADSSRDQSPHRGLEGELLPEAMPGRAAPAAPLAPPPAPSSPERVEASRPRTRLVFLPAPAGPSSSTSVPRSGPTPVLAQQVARGLTPVWDEAYRLTHEALTVERPSPPARAEVKNTFNVHVHLEPGGGGAVPDRTHLEDSLVDILRDAARRHGLEV